MKILSRYLFVLLISMFVLGCGAKTSGIEGKIVDGNGKPLAGISVIFKQVQPTQGYDQFETKTGPDGVFRLTGCAPTSEYFISTLSGQWKSKVTQKVKTLEAGQNLVLQKPIKIRFFNQLKDGVIVDTKTGLQWKIYSVKDMTAATILDKVKSLNEGGFNDWRLPSRSDLASLLDETTASKTQADVVKTCCAWVLEPDAKEVDWKFYIEEDNELWASSKETPDNRIIIVRNQLTAPGAAVAAAAPQTAQPAGAAPEVPASISPQLPGQAQTKAPVPIRYASRKACAEKKAKGAKATQAVPGGKPPAAPVAVATAPKTPLPAAKTTATTSPTPKTAAPVVPAPSPKVSTKKVPAALATAPKAVEPQKAAPKQTVVPPPVAKAPAPVDTKTKVDPAKVVEKAPAKKTEVAKAVPAKKAAVSKKRASVKKTSVAKKSDQAKIVQSEKATSTSSTIYFESGSSKLSAKELVKLKSFYSKVKYSKGTVVINGHSDASAKGETTTGNLLLSNERAANVLQSLNKMGLGNQIKLEMGTLGDTKPAASNDTPEGRKLNRRVELSFNPE